MTENYLYEADPITWTAAGCEREPLPNHTGWGTSMGEPYSTPREPQ